MELHYSLKTANKVLQRLKKDSRYKQVQGTIECYQNGREQGYQIVPYHSFKTIYFAQYRRSDGIVVYYGELANQGISDDAWNNKQFFDTPEQASDYIYGLLTAQKMGAINE